MLVWYYSILTVNYDIATAGKHTDVKADLRDASAIDSECLSLVCQETGCSLLDFRMRKLITNAPLHNSPGKCGFLESNCRGRAEQSAEKIEELHLGRDLLKASARRIDSKVQDELRYFNIFHCDGIAALGPLRLPMRRRRHE